ncbi:MAG TPA: serine hydrolase [Candidatus Sulfotelmatobacter sp.]|nr:serine hydrolase [Candidatus Sulfotelmatobacter sp.]
MGGLSLRSLAAWIALLGALVAGAMLVPTVQMPPLAVHAAAAVTDPPAVLIPAAQPALAVPVYGAPAPPAVLTAQAGILMDADTGRILWARNARQPRPMASLTKIFTAMEAVSLNADVARMVTVTPAIKDIPWDSTVMGLTVGETVSVRDLLDGMFLPSGNDAAMALAEAAGSRAAFIAGMNALAAAIGLRDTHFTNPWGADDPQHHASALDLAVAAVYLDAHYPALAAIAGTAAIDIPATSTHKAFHLRTLNKLLASYPGVTGLKTGWTGEAGGCLVGTATRNGQHLVSVLLGSANTFAETRELLDYGFARADATGRD